MSSPTPNYIKVNRLGERWGEKDTSSPHGGWKPYANFNEEICDFDRIPSWYVFDQTSFEGGSWGGMVGGAAKENGGMGIGYMTEGLDPELGGWEGWSADNVWELERGWITQGATLDELAAQINVPAETVGDARNFMVENQDVIVSQHDGTVLFVELPATVVLTITHTEPGLQGDRSSAGTKPATLETGYEIQVPLFMEEGTRVKVDTRDGSYSGRVTE